MIILLAIKSGKCKGKISQIDKFYSSTIKLLKSHFVVPFNYHNVLQEKLDGNVSDKSKN